MDRNQQLARRIVNYSCKVKRFEKVVIQVTGEKSKPLVVALIRELNNISATTAVINNEPEIVAELIEGIYVEGVKAMTDRDLKIINEAHVCIMIKSIEDESIMGNVSRDKMKIYSEQYTKPINKAILETTRWASLRYPNSSMAKRADMKLEEFEDYYFEVCNIDYSGISIGMDRLVSMMEKTKRVRIVGQGTDIEFSIEGMPVHKCDGIINLPDGEVYTAPVKESINGKISYNVPSIYNGVEFSGVSFDFQDGKIINARCDDENKNEALEDILNMDDGARYIGEFALGVNPYVIHPTKDILFDEKIAGSFHLTPGFAYKDAFNGNESSVHWDLVCIQRKSFGGGEIYFDDVLVRKDGMFLDEGLEILNPAEGKGGNDKESTLKVKLTILESKCRCNLHKTGDVFIVEDKCPEICHELWQNIYPSVYVLLNNGELDYGNSKEKKFTCRCNDGGRVLIQGELI